MNPGALPPPPSKRIKYLLKSGKLGIRIGPFGSSLRSEFLRAEGYKVYGQENLIAKDFRIGKRFIDDSKFSELVDYTISPKDILITMMGTTGKCAIFPAESELGIMDSHLIRLRLLEDIVLPEYFVYQISESAEVFSQLKQLNKGSIMEGLNSSIVKSLQVYLPSLQIQKSITAFLDKETCRIDALISKKERQIELLQEKRQAIITKAVTKGLDPNAKMKDSGVEWIGQIPTDWDVAPLYSRYELQLGKMLDAKQITGDHLVSYLRNVDVQWDFINTEDLPQMDILPAQRISLRLKQGDLLVCEGGEIGRAAIWSGELEECYFQKALHRLRPRTNQSVPRFLYYCLFSFATLGVFTADAPTSTIEHLTGERLRTFRVPFPPMTDQVRIVDYLDSEEKNMKSTIEKIDGSIELLKEYRSSLITAAVSGQIDVSKFSNGAKVNASLQ